MNALPSSYIPKSLNLQLLGHIICFYTYIMLIAYIIIVEKHYSMDEI